MGRFRKVFFVLAGMSIISCKKTDYVLYPIENICDSVVLQNTYFNQYKLIHKSDVLEAEIIKDQDSIKIFQINNGNETHNKILLDKDGSASWGGVTGVSYIVKKINDVEKPSISDSRWSMMESCDDEYKKFNHLKINKQSNTFVVETNLGFEYIFTYKTQDSINYKLYLNTAKLIGDTLHQNLRKYNSEFVTAEAKVLSKHLMKIKLHGYKPIDTQEINFIGGKGPETVYFYKK